MPYVNIHTHNLLPEGDVISVVNIFPWEEDVPEATDKMVFSMGLHPWFIEETDVEESLAKIERFLAERKLFGVGEAGLDAVNGPERDVQIDVFKRQVDLSERYGRPLIIHCVKEYNEMLALRRSTGAKQTWILHGFGSSPQMMEQLTGAGIFLSFGAGLLKSQKLQQVCSEVPDEMLFFENDVSETDIKEIYKKAAELREQSTEILKDIVFDNFKRI